MAEIKRYNFTLSESAQSDLGGIKLDNILIFRREGLAMQFEAVTYDTESVTGDAYSFRRKSSMVLGPFPSGKYISRITNSTVAGYRYQRFEIGTGVQIAGWRYRMTGDLGVAYYDPILSDTHTAVITGLASELTSLGYVVDNITTNTFRVKMAISDTVVPELTLTTADLYETGYFFRVPFVLYGEPAYKEYLISVSSSSTGYPALPTLAASYSFNDLEYTGVYGTQEYLYNGLYYFISYQIIVEDVTTITDVPTDTATVDPNKVGIDETNNKLILGTPCGASIERFDIIHKVP